jgi:hypothetical protein
MIPEIIAIIIIVVIGIFFLQMEHHARKFKIIIVALIGLLLYASLLGLFSTEKIDFKSPKSIVGGAYLYMGWIGKTASSLWDIGGSTVALVGNAIKINDSNQYIPGR